MIQNAAKKFVGIEDLAAYLGVRANTVRSWVWQRQIPYVKVGRLVRFDMQEVDTWIRDRRKEVVDIDRNGLVVK